ncbi:response regulator [Elusimicrobiota bacterium]
MKKILIVDDEQDVVTYLDTLLKDNGYETILALTADEAMKSVREKSPDLVSLDITMPGKSGIKVFREMRDDEKLKNIPIVVVTAITGSTSPDEFKNFLNSRKHYKAPEGFVPKPIDKDELIKMVKGLIG